MSYRPPPDLSPQRTRDGSMTLRSEALGEQYHSRHGAVQESRHVFIRSGLDHVESSSVDILEVGLGTGLNALLTWIEADLRGRPIHYEALDPFPLSVEQVRDLGHPHSVAAPEREEGFLRMMDPGNKDPLQLSSHFRFTWIPGSVETIGMEQRFDLIYFDAFAPDVQPELWTPEVFQRIYSAMRPGAILVTYCAKGQVRRNMRQAGLKVERIPGPPGKRQMFRARRPSQP